MDDEHAALRRVATLVGRAAPPEDVFAAVTEEVGRLLPVDFAIMARYEPGGTATYVASREGGAFQAPVGGRWALEGNNLITRVYETGAPAGLTPTRMRPLAVPPGGTTRLEHDRREVLPPRRAVRGHQRRRQGDGVARSRFLSRPGPTVTRPGRRSGRS
jgi:GAF domain-containing protein